VAGGQQSGMQVSECCTIACTSAGEQAAGAVSGLGSPSEVGGLASA